jgi:hypothetical protein
MGKNGVSIEARDELGDTPYLLACLYGHKGLVEMLAARGADKDARNNRQDSALASACRQGSKDVAEMLVKEGADKEARDVDQNTPLQLACGRGHKDVDEMLAQKGANVDARDEGGNTCLILAARWDHFSTCELLISLGVDLMIANNANKTALDVYGEHLDRDEDEDEEDDRPPALSAETKEERRAALRDAYDAYLLAVKRADNMDRRIPYIKVLADNRYRPLAYRLLEVPPVDPSAPIPPLAPETTHERQLTDVFGSEALVRYITSFV